MISKRIDIWQNYEYLGESNDNFRPTLHTYILENILDATVNKKRGAVLICPGGGYHFTSYREAEPIATKFTSEGFHAFVLDYSVQPRRHPKPLLDIARAMTIIRENAENWSIDTENIIVCGFSAGGHLAASLGVFWNKDYLSKVNGINKDYTKPNKLILCYPVITFKESRHVASIDNLLGENQTEDLLQELSVEKQVSENTPNTFIWHTFEDNVVPVQNPLLFAEALRKHNVPFEMHIYQKGGHGLSLANDETTGQGEPLNTHVATWFPLVIEWLKKS